MEKWVKFFHKNHQIFLQKLTTLTTKTVKFSYKNHQFSCKNCQVFRKTYQIKFSCKKTLNFSAKIKIVKLYCNNHQLQKFVRFFHKNHQIFLKKLTTFPTKIVKFSCEDRQFSCESRQVFLQNVSDFLVKNVKFSCKYH